MSTYNCSNCNCNCTHISYDICHNGCCCDNSCELDCIITNLKSELFEKQQNIKDYCSLQSKFIQLQNDIKALSDQKKSLEGELCRAGEEGNKLICGLKLENINLKNELNDKNCLNKKLYGDNNNLFQVLEGKTSDNENLHEQLCHQENILQRLNQDKISLQNTVQNLNQLREKHMKEIQDLNIQINLLNKDSDALDNTLRDKNCQNLQIINQFNNEKNINTDLVNILNSKECALAQIQKELCMANDTLARLENDINILNISNNKNCDEITCTNNNLIKETSLKNGLENNNTKLNCVINDRNEIIQKLSTDNDILKCNNTNINSDNNFLNSKIEAYKKHILILTDQNEKLSAELEAIISRDSSLLHTLGRDSHLRVVQNENNNAINSSLDYLKACSSNGTLNIHKSYNIPSKINNINESDKFGGYGINGSQNKSLYNSGSYSMKGMRNGVNNYYRGEEEKQYSSGEEDLGQNSGEGN